MAHSTWESMPIAMAVPVAPTAPEEVKHDFRGHQRPEDSSTSISEKQVQRLMDQGYTHGLATSLELSKKAFPLRFWIIDNSGSMQKCDGHRMVETRNRNTVKMVNCARWEEIQECVSYHIQLAGSIEAPTRFRFMNNPGANVGPQQFSVAEFPDRAGYDVQEGLHIISRARPGGVTPLTQHILNIHREVSAMAPTLRANGQRVSITIASDGLPTDERGYSTQNHRQEFIESLRLLEGLPVWVVIRLCTDEEDVVSFYNDLDQQLELSIEVLDDFCGEAEEVYQHNPWLTYGIPLHRLREMGFHDRVLDMLDERKLTKSEIRDFCALLFGSEQMDGIVDPNSEWNSFCKDIDRLLRKENQQWDPIKKRMKPWIDMHMLSHMYGDGSVCVIL